MKSAVLYLDFASFGVPKFKSYLGLFTELNLKSSRPYFLIDLGLIFVYLRLEIVF